MLKTSHHIASSRQIRTFRSCRLATGSTRTCRDGARIARGEFPEDGRCQHRGLVVDLTDRTLVEDRHRLQSAALRSADNAILITDARGCIAWVNPAFTRLTGYTAEEAVGQNPRLLKSDTHDQVVYKELWETISSGQAWRGELINRRKDGSLYTDEQSITPILDARGTVSHFIAISHDISKRKQVEAVLRESEERYRALVEATHQDIFIVSREGCLEYVSASAANSVGVRADRVVGQRLDELFPPRVASQLRRQLERVLVTRESLYTEDRLDFPGRTVWLGTWLVPVRDHAGEVKTVVGAARDISERMRAEDALRDSEDRFRSLAETANDAIISSDSSGTITFWNRAAQSMFGYTEEEALGKPLIFLMPERYRERHQAGLEHLRSTGQSHLIGKTVELHGLRNDGTEFPLELSLAAWKKGDETFYSAIIRDATARKQLEEQFRQAQKMEAIGRLAGGIAHDFNNLLTAILGYSDFVLDRVGDHPDIAVDVEEIKKAGERACRLTRQLLAFSRKQMLRPQVLDLNQVVGDLDKMLSHIIGEDIRLDMFAAPSLGHTKADPGQLEQVLMNLVVNARDAMPQGGTLTIATADVVLDSEFARRHVGAVPGRYVSLTVQDTGCGMTPEVLAHIFEPFFTTKGPDKGTGLGLVTVHGIVQQSGGYITVESTPGIGTSVTTYLPAVDDPVESAGAGPWSVNTLKGTETILLVEDDTGIRDLIRKVLEGYGYTVLQARDVDDAIAIEESHRGAIHLLLSDIIMPGLNGPDLGQRIVRRRPAIKVLYVSGFANQVGIDLGSISRSASLLQKPFTPETLARNVRECLDRQVGQTGRESTVSVSGLQS